MCVTMLRNGGIIVTVIIIIIIIIIIIRQTSAGARVLEQGGPWAVLGGTWRARGARAYNRGLGAEPPAEFRGRAPGQGVRGAKPS